MDSPEGERSLTIFIRILIRIPFPKCLGAAHANAFCWPLQGIQTLLGQFHLNP
jgi:hypothetical protein